MRIFSKKGSVREKIKMKIGIIHTKIYAGTFHFSKCYFRYHWMWWRNELYAWIWRPEFRFSIVMVKLKCLSYIFGVNAIPIDILLVVCFSVVNIRFSLKHNGITNAFLLLWYNIWHILYAGLLLLLLYIHSHVYKAFNNFEPNFAGSTDIWGQQNRGDGTYEVFHLNLPLIYEFCRTFTILLTVTIDQKYIETAKQWEWEG